MPLDIVGNTLNTAKLIQPSTGKYQFNISEQVGSTDTFDYYRFTLAGRSSLSLAAVDLSGDVQLNLLNSTGGTIASSNNSLKGSELLSSTLDAGTYYIQVTAGNAITSDYRLLFESQSSPKANIVWRNLASGVNASWQMDGPNIVGIENYLTVTDPNWQMVGVSDFNGDGQTDYLWRNASSNTTAIWEMQGSAIAQGYILQNVDSSWEVSLAADLNNDGKGDILWRHSSGLNAVWFMDGGTLLGAEYLPTVADRNWRMEAAGDFNYDGKTDLVWRNYASGENLIWLMNGSAIVSSMSLITVNDAAWKIEGAGDFNDDGKVDLLWHHTSGSNISWNLNGSQITSSTQFLSVPDANWQIIGVGRRFEAPKATDLPGDSAATALNLGEIGIANGNSVRVGDRLSDQDLNDYYRFTLTAPGVVDLILDGLSDNANLSIVQANGLSDIAFSGNVGINSESISKFLDAGSYYIKVSRVFGATGYFLNLTTRSQIQANPINQALRAGSTYSFTWQDAITENVKLDLYRNGSFDRTIDISTPSDGEYTWSLPSNILSGDGYQVRITSVNNNGLFGLSNSFSISPAIVKYGFTYYYNGSDNTADSYTGWVYGENGSRYSLGTSVDSNLGPNQTGANGRYFISSTQFDPSFTAAQLGQVYILEYSDQDPAAKATYTPWKYSQNQASGNNYLGSEADTIGSATKIFGDAKNFKDFGQDYYKFDIWEDPIDGQYQANSSVLGNQTSGYADATISPFGTKGKVVAYASGGTIHWSVKTGAIAVLNTINPTYASNGGSGGILGMPTVNQYAWGRGVRQDFEGGYIYNDGSTARIFKPNETPIVKYSFIYLYNGNNTTADCYTGWVYGEEGRYSTGSFVDPNAGANETGVNGRYQITGVTYYGNSALVGGDRGKVYVDAYYDMDRSDPTTYTPNSALRNVAAGTNYLGSEFADFNGGGGDYDFGYDVYEFDAKADLAAVSFDMVETQVTKGGTVNVNWQIRNLTNQATTTNLRVGLYLSKDNVITTSDYLIDNVDFGLFSAQGGSVLVSRSYVWPDAVSALGIISGTYYLGIVVDTNNAIAEAYETNNANRGQGIDWDSFTLIAPPVVTITSPNGNDLVRPGSNVTITWSDNIAENVKIELYKGNTLTQVIASSVASNGSYNWAIANNLTSGTDYRIKVSSVSNSSVFDWSDNNFSIKPDLQKYWFIYNFNSSNYGYADSYKGSVIAEAGRYSITAKNPDGTFKTALGYDYSTNPNEMGINGKYVITAIEDYNDDLTNEAGRVFVETYFDRNNGVETAYTPTQYSKGVLPAGFNYLGSEVDYIGVTQTTESKFGQDYFEATPRKDIDIQIFDPYNSFTSTWRWQAMQIAIENWEKLITVDKDSSGLFRIVVTNDMLSLGTTPWDASEIALAYVDTTINSRYNINQSDVDLNGVDYDNRVSWNANRLNVWSERDVISTMMHEVGHALGLPHDDRDAKSLMYPSLLPTQGFTEGMMVSLEGLGYSVDRNAISQIRWMI